MAIIDVVKCEMVNGEFCYKFPSDNLKIGTQLVVYPSQTAFFVKGGIICDSFQATDSPSSGCYVATAVYGSYDCPQVWTLRRFKDNTLAETWYGRVFIHTYYAISPTLVKWFGHTQWFRKMWKQPLDKLVNKLQLDGFDSTPYQDKVW